MANSTLGGYNNYNARGSYPNYGMPNQQPVKSAAPVKKSKKEQKQEAKKLQSKEYNKVMRARQERALENIEYRRKVEAINQNYGGMDRAIYKLAADVKPRKEKDYFFVMRKGACFFTFLFTLVTIAVFVLSYLKLDLIPAEYISIYIETEAAPVEEGEGPVAEAAGENEADEEADEEEEEAGSDVLASYSVLDPVFGFIKHLTGKFLNKEVVLGESPLYDAMVAKSEVGMADMVAGIALEYFPAFIIIYIITAIIMFFKAFFAMFGRRIFKCFGLGSFIMILCGGVMALAGLAFTTEPGAAMAYGDIINILIGGIMGTGGFTAGYGLLGLIVIPVLTLIFSMFARKKVPYSIFDN